MKKNIILCDCEKDEIVSLCDALGSDGEKFEIKSYISNWKRTGKFSELRRYGKYFTVAFRYFLKRRGLGVVVGWQQFYVLIISFFCSVFHVKKANVLVALNFTYKEKSGKFSKLYRWFMKRCLSAEYMDYIHVLSADYAKNISEQFDFPLDRIIVLPFGVNDPYEQYSKLGYPSGVAEGGYALSIGRSNRDYDFLISAWENVNYPLVIISDTYEKDNNGNENILILKNVAGEESYPWIAHCECMIIPIDDGSVCSGDTVLLTALAMKKKVLITKPSTLAEMYVADGRNGLCTEKSKRDFELIVSDMLFSDKYSYLGEAAREDYLNSYSRASMGARLRQHIKKAL